MTRTSRYHTYATLASEMCCKRCHDRLRSFHNMHRQGRADISRRGGLQLTSRVGAKRTRRCRATLPHRPRISLWGSVLSAQARYHLRSQSNYQYELRSTIQVRPLHSHLAESPRRWPLHARAETLHVGSAYICTTAVSSASQDSALVVSVRMPREGRAQVSRRVVGVQEILTALFRARASRCAAPGARKEACTCPRHAQCAVLAESAARSSSKAAGQHPARAAARRRPRFQRQNPAVSQLPRASQTEF